MSFIILLFSSLLFANPSVNWHSAVIRDRHEFYQNYEMIEKPEGTWQPLFSVEYKDSGFNLKKDCLFYRVPGESLGELKLINADVEKKCDNLIFEKADQEWKELRALQFAVEEHRLLVQLTFKNFELETWDVPLLGLFKHPVPQINMSSAEYRSPKVIFLRPVQSGKSLNLNQNQEMNEGEICHAISEDCREISKSRCMKCPQGWFEVPNGCPQAPKYCGVHLCGLKNRPACRRGRHYTGAEKKFDCRIDSSFAYCAKGLTINCQGNLAYCL